MFVATVTVLVVTLVMAFWLTFFVATLLAAVLIAVVLLPPANATAPASAPESAAFCAARFARYQVPPSVPRPTTPSRLTAPRANTTAVAPRRSARKRRNTDAIDCHISIDILARACHPIRVETP